MKAYQKVASNDIEQDADSSAHLTGEVPQGPASSDPPAAAAAAKVKINDFGNEEHRAIFWSRKQGIYFAYKWRCVVRMWSLNPR